MRAFSTRLPHLAALALAMLLGAGCAPTAEPESADDRSAITQVPSTPVENQAIGNCWLYATGAWAESLHLAATGQAFDISQSYWSYWDWYDQISSPGAIDSTVRRPKS